MNALVGDWECGSTPWRSDSTGALSPQTLELLTKALCLIVPIEQAVSAVGEAPTSGRRASSIYRELAQRESFRLQRSVAPSRTGLGQPLVQLAELSHDPFAASSPQVAGVVFRILSESGSCDSLLLRRIAAELDTLVYRMAARRT